MAAEDEIRVKDVTPTIDAFRTGDKILIDGPSGTANMSKDTLLELTAQNALVGNVAPEFVPNSTTTVAGKAYIYGGLQFVAKEAYQGPWDASKFTQTSVSEFFDNQYNADALGNIVLPLSKLVISISNVEGSGVNRTCDITINSNVIYWAGGYTSFSNTTFQGVRYSYTGIYAVINKKTRTFVRLEACNNSSYPQGVPASSSEVYLPLLILGDGGEINYRCDTYKSLRDAINNVKNKSYNCVALSDIDISFINISGTGNSRTCTVKFNSSCTFLALGGNYVKYVSKNTEIANCPYVYGGLYLNIKDNSIVPCSVGNSILLPSLSEDDIIFPIVQWQEGVVKYACYRYTADDIKKFSEGSALDVVYKDYEKEVTGNIVYGEYNQIKIEGISGIDGLDVIIDIDIDGADGFCALSWNGTYTSGVNFIEFVYFSGDFHKTLYVKAPSGANSLWFWTASSNISVGGPCTITVTRKCVSERIDDLTANRVLPALTVPKKMYVVCNDIGTSDVDARDYSVKMYADHIVRGVSEHIEPRFEDGKITRDLYSKIFRGSNAINTTSSNTTVDVATDTIEDNVIISSTEKYPVSFDLVSTRNKATEDKVCRLLCIGDSVTDGYLASWGKPYANAPVQYWAWVKMLFESDKIQNGGSGFFFESLGNINNNTFDIDFDGIDEMGVKAYACGVGGTTTADWLSPNVYTLTNPFYNPTSQKFSLKYWVENYRTLIVGADGKTTRCDDSNKGALVTDVNASNVCEPTHVLIQLGYNQSYSSTGTTRTNYLNGLHTMIDTIIEEYPGVKVLLSLPDSPCAYNVQEFKQFLTSAVTKDNFDASKGDAKNWHDRFGFMNIDLMDLETEYDGAVVYVPSYFAVPSVLAGCCKKVPDLSFLSNGNPLSEGYALCGVSPLIHPANAGHASIAYEIYSVLKNDLYNQE